MFSGIAVPETIPVRRWTAVIAFTLQAAAVAATLVFPLLYPQSLPQALAARHVFTQAVFQEVRTTENQPTGGHSTGLSQPRPLIVNNGHRVVFQREDQDTSGPAIPNLGNEISGDPSGPVNSIFATNFQPVIIPSHVAEHAPPTSVMMEGNLMHRVDPQYPLLAKQLRIQGTVVVKALISRTGTIEQAEVVSGPGLLWPAAIDAIRQWKYRPYILNGDPIEVETQVTVRFVLN